MVGTSMDGPSHLAGFGEKFCNELSKCLQISRMGSLLTGFGSSAQTSVVLANLWDGPAVQFFPSELLRVSQGLCS